MLDSFFYNLLNNQLIKNRLKTLILVNFRQVHYDIIINN